MNKQSEMEIDSCGNKSELNVDVHGTKRWYLNGEFHRENGPAVEYRDGYKFWYLYGRRHRVDGPAIEFRGEVKEYWLSSVPLTKDMWFQQLTPEQKYNYLWSLDEQAI